MDGCAGTCWSSSAHPLEPSTATGAAPVFQQGGDVTDPPWGGRNRPEGGVQKLGRLSDPLSSLTALLTCSLRDLRGFDREVMSHVRGRSRAD
eukprot:3044161-Prymnesium_polylepis.1